MSVLFYLEIINGFGKIWPELKEEIAKEVLIFDKIDL
jgi:hypothetical protein